MSSSPCFPSAHANAWGLVIARLRRTSQARPPVPENTRMYHDRDLASNDDQSRFPLIRYSNLAQHLDLKCLQETYTLKDSRGSDNKRSSHRAILLLSWSWDLAWVSQRLGTVQGGFLLVSLKNTIQEKSVCTRTEVHPTCCTCDCLQRASCGAVLPKGVITQGQETIPWSSLKHASLSTSSLQAERHNSAQCLQFVASLFGHASIPKRHAAHVQTHVQPMSVLAKAGLPCPKAL